MTKLLPMLINVLLSMLTPELMKKFADMVLDFAEDFVLGSKSTVDDAIVLPVCSLIRSTFNIPDDDI